jgi:hypothetical protein
MVGRWGMLTLTVPGHGTDGTEWHDLVPTPAALKAARRAFRWRWERQFSDWSGCWKLEYQRRGAPHFHVGVQVPTQLPEGWTGAQVHEWVRATWHEVLCHPNAQQDGGCPGESCPHREHAVHGAQLDAGYSDRLRRAGDAFASYFAKHGVWSSKEYQHALPGWRWRAQAAELRDLGDHGGADQLDELADAWDHPGRWWGVENVERAPQADGEMTPAEVEAARLVGRKVMARRTWRYVEHAEGRRPVLTRRVPRSFYGTAGFWLLMRNPSEFRWWFLAEVRKVAQLHGVERARYLATICEPGGRPPPPRRRTPAQALEVSR